MDQYIVVTTTIDDKQIADQITQELLKKRLVSCVQKREVTSSYWWKGKIEIDKEFILEMKSRKALYKEIEQEILKLHSYENPEIFATDMIEGSKSYLDWIKEETTRNNFL